ncbi:MAG: aldo/keto reductase [Deltaproteobacteria bacterium]|nr:MAG: aldo/keto reductase [Deltaproteobacteria bacterium]
METRPFGKNGPPVPILGQGTWQMEQDPRREAIAALRRGLDLGLRHIDTAEMYGSGAVEEMVAEAIEGRREEVFLVSKVLPENATRRGTVVACERSLKRLRTDHLDCYLLHWESRHPLEGTIEAFEELRGAGKVRAYGVSNFDEERLQEAVSLAGPGLIACDQVLYHLEERHADTGLISLCRRLGAAFVAYSPFGSGSFPAESSAGGKMLAAIARAHRKTPRQVALAFLTRLPGTFAIPKAASRAHVEENAGAARLKLSAEEIARIDEAFPARRKPELPTL